MSKINLAAVLKSNFNLDSFRPLQREVIEHVLRGGSGLVLMPTGSGKSLTYQLPSVLGSGTSLVISPLKALMKDQVDKLRKSKIRAGYVNSDVSKNEREKRLQALADGRYQIFYVTPERFRKPEFVEIIKKINVKLLVVDEAHCISQWGHDFRPEYSKVGEFHKLLRSDKLLRNHKLLRSDNLHSDNFRPPVLALTATATMPVRDDIMSILEIKKDSIFSLPITRSNLAIKVYDVYGLEEKVQQTRSLLQGTHSSGENLSRENTSREGSQILYFSLIQTLQNFSKELQKYKISHEIYHGNLAEPLKRKAQENFLSGKSQLILATPAFGLGIDKPDVRAVIHLEIPGSIEAYFQEIGRAGRDGEPARCVLFYDQDDVSTQMEFIKWSHPEWSFIQKVFDLIKKNPERVRQEGADFLREQMNFHNRRDFRVETVINLLTSWDIIEGWAVIRDLDSISKMHGESYSDTDGEKYCEKYRAARLQRQNEKLLNMVQFVKTTDCRMRYIHNYFSAPDIAPCGVCDICLG